jgi:hypothetical protein
MSKTAMPGFTAEAACYPSGAPYRAGSLAPSVSQRNEVIPSAPIWMHAGEDTVCWGYSTGHVKTCCWDFADGIIDCFD